MQKITMVIDLQYGSTGKGLLAGYLAETTCPDTIITAWAPNAGHTYIDRAGRKYIHTHLANGIVSPFCKRVFLGPGSMMPTVVGGPAADASTSRTSAMS